MVNLPKVSAAVVAAAVVAIAAESLLSHEWGHRVHDLYR